MIAPTASHSIHPKAATIGDPLTYTITLETATPIELTPPDLDDPFHIATTTQDMTTSPTRSITIQRSTIQVFDTGPQTIPTQTINLDETTLLLPALPIEIIATTTSDRPPAPSTTLYKLPINWGPIIGITLFIVCLLGVGRWFWKKRSRIPAATVTQSKPSEPPHIIAHRALDALQQSPAYQDHQYTTVIDSFSQVLTTYISQHFTLSCEELSSREILDLLTPLLDEQTSRRLHHCFELCDWVKFADYIPTTEHVTLCMQKAREFIDRTKPE